MHNSFIFQQYICYTTLLNMFRAAMLFILRRTNCITTASDIVTLCKQPYSVQVESGLHSALHLRTVHSVSIWGCFYLCNCRDRALTSYRPVAVLELHSLNRNIPLLSIT